MCNMAGAMSKMFCLVAKNKFMEDHTVGQMCRKIEFFGQMVLNITIPDSVCTTTLKTLWEKAAQTCPHQSSVELASNNIDIDSTMCSLLDNKTIEDQMVSDICAEAKIPGCKLMAPKIWGVADTMCNKAGAMSKMFCMVAKNKFMEDNTVGQMCRKLEFFGQKVLNITIPDSVCTTTLKT